MSDTQKIPAFVNPESGTAEGARDALSATGLFDIRGVTHRPDGEGVFAATYAQQHEPVAKQTKPVGHAVRATYLYAGMADVAAMLGLDIYNAAAPPRSLRIAFAIYLVGMLIVAVYLVRIYRVWRGPIAVGASYHT